MTPKDRKAQNREKLQSLLRELFQFDSADLDFGIYRIMNQKRDEIERFIENDLLDAVQEALAQFRSVERQELEAKLDRKREDIGPEGFDEQGEVRQDIAGLTVVRDYLSLQEQLQSLEVAEQTEAHVFNDLYTFFSRYYDNGDFLTERRWSSKEPKFAVPYNGEEVLLHWANRDQYYVKTSEHFTDYRFTARDYTILFRLERAEVGQDNVKSDKRYFVLRDRTPLEFHQDTKSLTIFFEYRPVPDDEEARLVSIYNARQPKSDRRKELDRRLLCEVLEIEILQALDEADVKPYLSVVPEGRRSSILGQHLNRYTASNTMDYFVHKDLGSFLRRELHAYLKTQVLRLDDVLADKAGELSAHLIARARVVKQVAERIIAILAQIENYQKRLFEKKKFVVQTDYCVTLDRVGEGFYTEILENKAQLQEWRRLYSMGAWEQNPLQKAQFDAAFLRDNPHVMLDTAFFDDDFKARLLETFDDLDRAIDGVLIHGENFQALNLLLTKYAGELKCVYIDPPYNTGNDEFLYKDNYRHSSWLAMMRDRLRLCRDLLRQDGVVFISIDDNEVHRLDNLLRGLYGEGNSAALLIARTNPRGRTLDKYVAKTHEYVAAFVKETLPNSVSEVPKVDRMLTEYNKEDERGRYRELGLRNRNPVFNRQNRPNLFFPIYVNPDTGQVSLTESETFTVEVYPRNSRGEDDCWTWGPQKVADNYDIVAGRQVSTGGWTIFRKDYLNDESGNVATTMVKSVWLDKSINNERGKEVLRDIMGHHTIDFPKAVDLIRKCVEIGSTRDSLVMDFFAGSGTTAHAVMELNRENDEARKYILVEMADYFDTVLRPRIQKLAFSASWKDGAPQNHDGISHMFKYQRLESYEDCLNNIRVSRPEGSQRELLYQQTDDYVLSYMLDFETRDSPSLLTPEAFAKPFQYTLRVHGDHRGPRDTVVDLVETFHYLIGLNVRKLEQRHHQGRRYVVTRGEVRTEQGVEKIVTVWRDSQALDLEEEAAWANTELLREEVDRVYVNGPSFISKAEPLEIAFRQRMEEPASGV